MKKLTKAEIEAIEPANYIETIIKKDMLEHSLNHIVTRFPPEPNGYLHIGHVKACLISINAAEKFGGYANLRFDDTNPNKEDIEYENAILDTMKWLGLDFKNVFYASDYYETMFEKAVFLIKKGLAFVCDLPAEEISKTRGTFTEPGTNSPYRTRSIEESLQLFQDMRAGKFADGSKTLRAKIDMASPNMNLRDPVIYRIAREHHYRTDNKWCIYPMYDFAHPIEDCIEGITHSLCSLEFEDHFPLYKWVVENCEFDNLALNPPHEIEFARLNVDGVVTSKRHIRSLIEAGRVRGWDDPRLPTLMGMRARGYSPAALKDFISRVGCSRAYSSVHPSMLEACVRDDLNLTATRVMVVTDPIRVKITNMSDDAVEYAEIDNNPNVENGEKHPASFSNELYIEREDFALIPPPKYNRLVEGGMVRLKGAYIIKCNKAKTNKDGNVTELECEYIKESKSGNDNSGIKVKGTIHWVDAKSCVDVQISEYGPLIKEGQTFDGNWEGVYNEDSLRVLNGKGEQYLTILQAGARLQFVRKGYYILASKQCRNFVFNQIVSLKDGYKK